MKLSLTDEGNQIFQILIPEGTEPLVLQEGIMELVSRNPEEMTGLDPDHIEAVRIRLQKGVCVCCGAPSDQRFSFESGIDPDMRFPLCLACYSSEAKEPLCDLIAANVDPQILTHE